MKKFKFLVLVLIIICLLSLLTGCNVDYSNNLKNNGYIIEIQTLPGDGGPFKFGDSADEQAYFTLFLAFLFDNMEQKINKITYAYTTDKKEMIVILDFDTYIAASKSYAAKKRDKDFMRITESSQFIIKKHGKSIYYGTEQAYKDAK